MVPALKEERDPQKKKMQEHMVEGNLEAFWGKLMILRTFLKHLYLLFQVFRNTK